MKISQLQWVEHLGKNLGRVFIGTFIYGLVGLALFVAVDQQGAVLAYCYAFQLKFPYALTPKIVLSDVSRAWQV